MNSIVCYNVIHNNQAKYNNIGGETNLSKKRIAAYMRISVDTEKDRDNTSIENQKAIIEDFVKHKFPGFQLTFYEDRDRSGYTFEQREEFEIAPTEVGIV